MRHGIKPGLSPISPIERTVIDGFAEMSRRDAIVMIQIGDGTADSQDFIVCSCRESRFVHRGLQQRFGFSVEFTMFAKLPRRHFPVCSSRLTIKSVSSAFRGRSRPVRAFARSSSPRDHF